MVDSKARIIEEDLKTANGIQKFRYFDRNGVELHEGDIVRYKSGRWECLYLTEDGELGTDATIRDWIMSGRAYECEYGIYPLTHDDVSEIQKIN